MATIGNVASLHTGGTASTFTCPITIGSSATRKIAVWVPDETTATITGLTFDGVSFVANQRVAYSHPTSTALTLSLYDYDIPQAKGAGTYDIVLTVSAAAASISIYVYEILDAASGGPEATNTNNWTTTATAGSATLTATVGAVVLATAACTSGGSTFTWSADVTGRTPVDEVNFQSAWADAANVSAGSKTATATWGIASQGDKIVALASYATSSGTSTPAFGRYGVRGPVR